MRFRSHVHCLTLPPVVLATALVLTACSSGGGGGGGVQPLVPATDFGTWIAPTFREDNTPLDASTEIKSYRVYFGPAPGDYIRDLEIEIPPAITTGIEDLITARLTELGVVVPVGTYFVVTAVDQEDRESLFSSEVVAR